MRRIVEGVAVGLFAGLFAVLLAAAPAGEAAAQQNAPAGQGKPAAQGEPSGRAPTDRATEAREIARVEAYLSGIRSLKGRFVQVAPDGRVSEGEVYLQRPGRLRFDYDEPVPVLIVADGTWLGIWDRELKQADRLPLSSTPLHVLVAPEVSFGGRFAVRRVEREPGYLRLTAYDGERAEDGEITLIFSDDPLELRQWVVRDARAQETRVSLYDTVLNAPLDVRLFVLTDSGPSVP